jgi:Tol biopolymer transport system component/DNA-binding winged helix-turn-helix (wHTH) protein
MTNQANGLYEFGSFRLDAAKRLLSRAGEPVTLAPKTFAVLLLLVKSEGRVLTKRELMNALWPETFVEEASLSYQIAALRKALGDECDGWIETVPKYGYRFAAPTTKIRGAQDHEQGRIEHGLFKSSFRHAAPWLAAAVAVLLLAIVTVAFIRKTAPAPQTIRFVVFLPEKTTFTPSDFSALSPGGDRLALTATGSDGKRLLYLRPLDSLTARPLPGTEGAFMPFWSPDGRSIAFFEGDKLKRIDARGGPALILCDAPSGSTGVWNRDGVILFSNFDRWLYRVAAMGGEASRVSVPDLSRHETFHFFPQFLPDGRHFLYFALSMPLENSGVDAASVDSKETKRIVRTNAQAVYAAPPRGMAGPGYLLFLRGNTLMAQFFEAKKLELMGDPLPVADELEAVTSITGTGAIGAAFSLSDTGMLAYHQGRGLGMSELVWLDRNGRRLSTVGDPADYTNPTLSPDEKKLAVGRRDPESKTRDIWIFDLERGASSRFTFDPADDLNPTWSPDGNRIAFTSDRRGHRDIYQKPAGGAGQDELLIEATKGDQLAIDDWSGDGKTVLFNTTGEGYRSGKVWMLPLDGNRKPSLVIESRFETTNARLSPDGRWIAYSSRESGNSELYVQNFPPSGSKWQISTNGGDEPQWRRDGKELFYLAGDNRLMAVDVKTESSDFQAGVPKPLFELHRTPARRRNHYVVAANGQRFLAALPLDETTSSHITVVTNWMAGMKR